jgi:hypothetical protein
VGDVAGVNSIPTSNGGMTSTFSVRLNVMGPTDPSIRAPSSMNLSNGLSTGPSVTSDALVGPTHDYRRTIPPVCSYSVTVTTATDICCFQRQCNSKTCRRTIPSDTSGAFCVRCRARIKKHQLKVKQKFRLEPKKYFEQGNSNSVKGDEGDDTGEGDGDDEEEVVGLVNGQKS